MEIEVEPMQQPVRRKVGRTPTPRQRLAQLEDMISFVQKNAYGALARAEGDYFPVRKVVGGTRPPQF
jgi:hypothetical protein